MWEIWANQLLPKTLKSGTKLKKNRPIWSHWLWEKEPSNMLYPMIDDVPRYAVPHINCIG